MVSYNKKHKKVKKKQKKLVGRLHFMTPYKKINTVISLYIKSGEIDKTFYTIFIQG